MCVYILFFNWFIPGLGERCVTFRVMLIADLLLIFLRVHTSCTVLGSEARYERFLVISVTEFNFFNSSYIQRTVQMPGIEAKCVRLGII